MDWKEYQRLAARTEAHPEEPRRRIASEVPHLTVEIGATRASLNPHRLIRLYHALVGLVDEVGEIAKALKKTVFYGAPLDRINLGEEAGDTLWYLALLLNALDLSMDEVAKQNIEKLKVRFPDKYSDDLAKEENRDRAAERQAVTVGEAVAVSEHAAKILAEANALYERNKELEKLAAEDG